MPSKLSTGRGEPPARPYRFEKFAVAGSTSFAVVELGVEE